ncbi:hypothetical protein LEL_08312 [Akanthomyces lecanii RCEF 1005]|uniref:Uncharacterized protein n=1 Tax=Akanthomyces lecanii RCEF 1005 TaxID=1081108 RepID=A0A168F6F1_CORDF|nr:hypothetical protein LEL_08312 [Akanthomyces lecanii RCEF 1005]
MYKLFLLVSVLGAAVANPVAEPEPAAAGLDLDKRCTGQGQFCNNGIPCCPNLYCGNNRICSTCTGQGFAHPVPVKASSATTASLAATGSTAATTASARQSAAELGPRLGWVGRRFGTSATAHDIVGRGRTAVWSE